MTHIEVAELSREGLYELHKKMWNYMAKMARSGEIPNKSVALEYLGINPDKILARCPVCHWCSNKLLSVKDSEVTGVTTQKREGHPWNQCNWCLFNWSPDAKFSIPCVDDASPYSILNEIIYNANRLTIRPSKWRLKEMAELCETIANLEMLPVIQ